MSDRSIIDWPAWTESPPGHYVLEWEQALLDRVVSDVFGYHALQLALPQLDALREKTRGNLSKEDDSLLIEVIGSLKLTFMEISKAAAEQMAKKAKGK